MNHLDLQIIMTIETKSIKKNKRYRIDGSRVDGICKREGGCVYGREGGGGAKREDTAILFTYPRNIKQRRVKRGQKIAKHNEDRENCLFELWFCIAFILVSSSNFSRWFLIPKTNTTKIDNTIKHPHIAYHGS